MKFDTLVVATRNPHKAEEIRALLAGLPITIRDLREFPDCPDVEEDGETLEDNAWKKAVAASRCTGLPVIADDTGLEVHYLLGAPGVRSARYAGEHASYDDNNRKLIRVLTQVPARRRQARFRCVIALVAQGVEEMFEGKVDGDILLAPRGSNGFGYDPIFRPVGFTESYAELDTARKNAISHRGRAIEALRNFLTD
ncbi:MAG: RdgB/HAM1 family non-canonical purine NTP pyrophosphatase [Bacteroidota bacterium]|jgi:XTP/dITP diphosphohydrolase|nr:RdgB/HAM1 family non-canonical purine NTP pyrophosphatase [Bacteroidota bacterium]